MPCYGDTYCIQCDLPLLDSNLVLRPPWTLCNLQTETLESTGSWLYEPRVMTKDRGLIKIKSRHGLMCIWEEVDNPEKVYRLYPSEWDTAVPVHQACYDVLVEELQTDKPTDWVFENLNPKETTHQWDKMWTALEKFNDTDVSELQEQFFDFLALEANPDYHYLLQDPRQNNKHRERLLNIYRVIISCHNHNKLATQ